MEQVMNVQFKKGVLELCVLSILRRGDCYGYELVETLSKELDVAEGTVYPLLRRLNAEGFFETYLRESALGPPRKYYRLTSKGIEYYDLIKAEWENFIKRVLNILEKKDEVHE